MKICPECKSKVDDNFELCWNCQYSFSEKRVISTKEFSEVCPYCNVALDSSYEYCPHCEHKLGLNCEPFDPSKHQGDQKIDCLRCKEPMFFRGNSNFHEGARMGALGDIFELLENRESFDVYFCPTCGNIEFFLPKDKETEE
jgi:hypothetical protein